MFFDCFKMFIIVLFWFTCFLIGLMVKIIFMVSMFLIGDKEYISTEKESELIFESCYNVGK